MKVFRINLFLKFKDFLLSLFRIIFFKPNDEIIQNILKNNSKKKYSVLVSQCRVGLILILNFLKKKEPNKDEIIFASYNLPAMVNIAKQIKFKIIFSPINIDDGSFEINKLEKKINKKTSALVLTNMFNSHQHSLNIKKLCKRKKVTLIEDNAIYFDNFYNLGRKKIFSGTFGDYTIYSFNIMKNISALYGGAICCDSADFKSFYKANLNNFRSFSLFLILKQIMIYLILKTISLKYVYNYLFFRIVKFAHIKNNMMLMKIFYPSLRFKINAIPNFYYSKINVLSKELVFKQLINIKSRNKNHILRKKKNMYYSKKFNEIKLKEVKNFKITQFNFQNFVDFPIIVEKKNKLVKFLLEKGIELKTIHYQDCSKIFKNKTNCKTSSLFEKKIVCLPNHGKVSFDYIDNIILNIKNFYKTN
jgi:dTDP-4-amino-4,6-dideoxygalactose transaminase